MSPHTSRQGRIGLSFVLGIGLAVGLGAQGWGQEGSAEHPVIVLWPSGAPGAKGSDPNRDVPSMTAWPAPADKATGASVVVCPGGGYGMLADDHEGKQVAEWLNSLGLSAFVLKYRLGPRYHHPAMLHDVQRAVRTVRAQAGGWHLDPKRVAVMGFSAGGHLASTIGTHFDMGNPHSADPIDRESCRPDRLILVYPVIAISTEFGHGGSVRNLLGEKPERHLIEDLSNELRVSKDTPPTFLAHTNQDRGVPAENSILFALALRKARVPVELHLFERGNHGLGLGSGSKQHGIGPEPSFQAWPKLCETWLGGQGFLDRPTPDKVPNAKPATH